MEFKNILDAYLDKYNKDMKSLINNETVARTKGLIQDYKNTLCQARAEMSPVDYERYYNKYCLMSSGYTNGLKV